MANCSCNIILCSIVCYLSWDSCWNLATVSLSPQYLATVHHFHSTFLSFLLAAKLDIDDGMDCKSEPSDFYSLYINPSIISSVPVKHNVRKFLWQAKSMKTFSP